MRCTQPMGLAPSAVQFLEKNAKREDPCAHCNRDSGYRNRVIGKVGMFDDLDLHEYAMVDGTFAKEYVQHEVWSSGPMIWVALEVGPKKYEWPESELID